MSVAPTTELELCRNLKPDSIVEGNDVYFECRIRCNPPPHRILWTHEVNSLFFCFSFTNWVLCLDRWDSLFFIATPIKTYRSLWVAAVVRGLVAPQRRRTKPEKYAQTFESKRFRIQRKWKFPRFFFSVPLNRKRILLFKLSRFFFSTYTLNKQWELFLFLFSPFALFVIPFPFWLNYNKSDDASESGTGYELQGLAVRNKALGSTIPLNQF